VIVRLQRRVGQAAAAFLLPDCRSHDGRHHTAAVAHRLNVVNHGQEIVELANSPDREADGFHGGKRFRSIAQRAEILAPSPH
jgi:hypothetical protein